MRRALSILLAVIYTACTSNTDPNTAAYWLDRLDDREQRIEAIKELGRIKDKAAIPPLLELFAKEGDWQPDIAYALGQIGDASVVKPLIDAIDFEAGSGRSAKTVLKNRINQNIARALAMLQAKEGVEPLLRLLKGADTEARTVDALIRSLGELGDKGATKALGEIATSHQEPFLRKTAIQAMGNIGDPAGVPTLIKTMFIEYKGISFYIESRFALQQIGKPAIDMLMKTIKRENSEVEEIKIGGNPIADGAIEAKAAFVLGAIKAEGAATPMIEVLNKLYNKFQNRERDPIHASIMGGAMELCYSLGNLGDKAALPLLQKIALDDDANMRMAATEALTTMGDASAVDTLVKAARKGPMGARIHSIIGITRLGGGDQVEEFAKLAEGVRDAMPEESFTQFLTEGSRLDAAKECNKDIKCWTGKLSDSNSKIRERAASELGRLGATEAIPSLLKAAEEDDATVRMAATIALGQFNKGIDFAALQGISDRWKDKVAYQNSNAELRRIAARLKSSGGK